MTDPSLDRLSAVVHRAVNDFADRNRAWAGILGWPREAVDRNPAHAQAMVATAMARNAIVHHLTQPPAARPAPASSVWDRAVQAGGAALRQSVSDTANAIAHPIQATTDYIARNRVTHSGNHYLDRAADILGGAEAGTIANLILGGAKLADLYHRYGPGQVGLVEDALARRGLIPPSRPLADRAYEATTDLRRQAALRPPRTFAGKLLAAAPNALATVLAPEAAIPVLLGAQGVGAAYDRARQTHAPDGLRTDLGILASGATDAAVGTLRLRVLRGPEAADLLARLPDTLRGQAQDFITPTVAKITGAGLLGGAQQAGDNLIAKASFDPDRPWAQGVGDSALISGLMAAPFGAAGGGTSRDPVQLAESPPTPSSPSIAEPGPAPARTNYGLYEILAEQPITGRSREAHRASANRALHRQLEADRDYSAQLDDTLGADVISHMRSGSNWNLRNPPGSEWHHPTDMPGVLHLLRWTEHRDPLLRSTLHPNRQGGFVQNYAVPASANPVPDGNSEGGN